MRHPALTLMIPAAVLGLLIWAGGEAWSALIVWLMDLQRQFHRELAQYLRALEAGRSITAGLALVTVSFLYGLFHAAGPGHGKAVIATYLLTHESRLKRGILLAVVSSLLQGMVAVLLVTGLVSLVGWLPQDTNTAITWSERLSFALLAGMGGLFAARAVFGLASTVRVPAQPAEHHHHEHEHHHDHGTGCGCSHGPSRHQIEHAHGLKATLGIILSVGLRPCSGAVLVLALANVLGLTAAGIAAVAAMSAGTAITVATLAVITVKARHWAAILLGAKSGPRWMGQTLALAGGAAILLLGVSLLIASFGPTHPLRL
jgi:ABC-type nickel/cobalt efflux system permease component RcnA